MLDHPVVRSIGAVAALIGVLTGVGTIIGWIASDEFGDTALHALRVAGLVYGMGACLTGLVVAVRVGDLAFVVRAVIVVVGGWGFFSTVYWGVIGGEDPTFWMVMGAFGLTMSVVTIAIWSTEQASAYRGSRMVCPDCAETVKSAARVCRHCGYRFEPPLADSR